MSEPLSAADEQRIATFFADPRWPAISALVEQLAPGSVEPIEAIVRKVRATVWRDLSNA